MKGEKQNNIENSKSFKIVIIVMSALLAAIATVCVVLAITRNNSDNNDNGNNPSINSEVEAGGLDMQQVIIDPPKPVNNSSSSKTDGSSSTESSSQSSNQSSAQSSVQGSGQSSDTDSTQTSQSGQESSGTQGEENKSESPIVTIKAPVAEGVYVIGGYCSKNTEYISVSGASSDSAKIIPYDGKDKKYFLAQVNYKSAGMITVSAKEKGKEESNPSYEFIIASDGMDNYMFRNQYAPIMGKNSQMHFSSALLSYTLDFSTKKTSFIDKGHSSIERIVSLAESVGAEPIFLIIPSSAEIYPETVPDGYTKTSGESLYEVFKAVAEQSGAKVIYPLETMKKHKNDGVGYQLYQHTDSHWSTYGAYWGCYDLFKHISKNYPAAAPRTLSEMGFYLTEMDAGDGVFNYPENTGFEPASEDRRTRVTKMRELTSLYSLKMPSETLKAVYHNNSALYLGNQNEAAATVINKNGKGLPGAVIMRDSFSKVSYDMMNDRFSRVDWGQFDNYDLPYKAVSESRPDYLIYLYSERNLLKLLVEDKNFDIMNFR